MHTSTKPNGADGDFWFDEEAADRAVSFFPDMLRHSKGQWAGRPMHLAPWQEDVIRPLFGWKRKDGSRRYRQCYIEVPRKNGKSTLAAGIALYMLFADGEPGAEVYSCAADQEQAGIVFARPSSRRSSDMAVVICLVLPGRRQSPTGCDRVIGDSASPHRQHQCRRWPMIPHGRRIGYGGGRPRRTMASR